MAYRIFYEAYFNRLWRYLLVVASGNEDTAREAFQATLLRVTRHIKVFRDELVFWSWLTVLARSACRDETKKRRRYFSFLDRFKLHAESASDDSPDKRFDQAILQNLLNQQVTLLPSDEQELVEQKYLAHRSVREIAESLQTTEKAVESKLSRIRGKLKNTVLAKLNDERQE